MCITDTCAEGSEPFCRVLHLVETLLMATGMGNRLGLHRCFTILDLFIHILSMLMQEGGELEMEEEPEPAPYAKTLTMDRPW